MNEESQHVTHTQPYENAGVMQYRLDTSKLLSDIEAFLRGTRVAGFYEQDGMTKPLFDKMGRPRMNDEGIQDIMAWIEMLFNPQTVQGNKSDEELADMMGTLREDLAENLFDKQYEYGIRDSDVNSVINKIVYTAEWFFSRTKDNLERESYGQTMRSVERVSNNNGGMLEGLNPFAKKR